MAGRGTPTRPTPAGAARAATAGDAPTGRDGAGNVAAASLAARGGRRTPGPGRSGRKPAAGLRALARSLLPLLALGLLGCAVAPEPVLGSERAGRSANPWRGYAPVAWWGGPAPSVSVFVGLLAPYGRWAEHPVYGLVFVPRVAVSWRPYTLGRWVRHPGWGWMWRSVEPFGWATAHYGRWGHDSRFGWFWVPDVRFGPHWVAWRAGPSAIGWAALPPPGWGRAWPGRDPWSWPDWWVFVPLAHFHDPFLWRHLRPPAPRWRQETQPVAGPPRPPLLAGAAPEPAGEAPPGSPAPDLQPEVPPGVSPLADPDAEPAGLRWQRGVARPRPAGVRIPPAVSSPEVADPAARPALPLPAPAAPAADAGPAPGERRPADMPPVRFEPPPREAPRVRPAEAGWPELSPGAGRLPPATVRDALPGEEP